MIILPKIDYIKETEWHRGTLSIELCLPTPTHTPANNYE